MYMQEKAEKECDVEMAAESNETCGECDYIQAKLCTCRYSILGQFP